MIKKAPTIDLKGKEYATVPARIKLFREDCPNGLIETEPVITENTVMFKARVLKDKSKPESGEATGHSIGKLVGDKAFEKLETIAIGRALAILGFMASGEIASSEEMEEFYDFVEEKKQNELLDFQAQVSAIDTLEGLKEFYQKHKGWGKELDQIVVNRKNQLTQS